jgi:hypothetical protein
VGVVVLSVVFLLTVAFGAALAKGVLILLLRLMVEPQFATVATIRTAAAGLIALVR